jgi:nitrogen fixation protein FixH
MELNDKLIEAIIMSATVGQFGGQIVYETFKLSIDELSAAKKQLLTHMISGLVAFFAYVFTQDAFVIKAASLAFLSGMFAEAALKLLKKKNKDTASKTEELAAQVIDLERQDREARIKELEAKIKDIETKEK